jgi:hypothetical protein
MLPSWSGKNHSSIFFRHIFHVIFLLQKGKLALFFLYFQAISRIYQKYAIRIQELSGKLSPVQNEIETQHSTQVKNLREKLFLFGENRETLYQMILDF